MTTTALFGGRSLKVAATGLLAAGAILLFHGIENAPEPPPQPDASWNRPLPPATVPPTAGHAATGPASPAILPFSEPVHLRIHDVGIDIAVMKVGHEADGTISTPTAAQARSAGWYTGSSAPGQAGPSIIVGHVDSRALTPTHQAAFYNLGSVRPGETIDIQRADRVTAEFTVDSVQVVKKNQFPAMNVYGRTDYAGLRLITCGGSWTRKTSYDSNVIVYAHMTSSRTP